jgi:hypothetical protein
MLMCLLCHYGVLSVDCGGTKKIKIHFGNNVTMWKMGSEYFPKALYIALCHGVNFCKTALLVKG